MIDDTTRGKISVWMGTSTQTPEEFNRYTQGMEDPDSGCPAHRDFGCGFIDSDFFIAYGTAGNKIVPVEELVVEVDTYSTDTDRLIVARCHELGVHEGNSLYFYDHCTFHEEQPGRLYNQLRFIGTFDNAKPNRSRR
jgi:hypothetical protein